MRKIRAVIDTNVVVSGVISPKGSPRKVLEMAMRGAFHAVISVSINHEILSVLHRDYIYDTYNLTEEIIDDISSFLYEGTILTEDHYAVSKIQKDLADNKFIACALEGEADYIVSGDEHLLSLKHYRSIQIIDAGGFLKILSSKQ